MRSLAEALRAQVGPNDLVVASSDFTHYGQRFGYTPFTEKLPWNLEILDMGAYTQIAALSLDGFWRYHDDTGITVCGFMPIALTLAMLPGAVEAHLLK